MLKHLLHTTLILLFSISLLAQESGARSVGAMYNLSLTALPAEGGLVEGAGIYEQGTSVTATATANGGYIFQYWMNEANEIVSEEAEYSFSMPANNLNLTANFVCTPGWEEVENLQYNMQVVAQIRINNEVSINPNTLVGAFVGDECRGIASPMPDFDGLVFLTVSSNEIAGELVELRIWDSEFCESCIAAQAFEFENQVQIGSLDEPFIIECLSITNLNIDFNQGYTWFSLNVVQFDMSPNALLSDLEPCYNDRIIGQHSFAVYSGTEWVGSLTHLSPTEMYRMRLCSAQSIDLISNQAPNDPLQLSAGSSWIGYLPNTCLSVNEALADLTPEPAYNDRILGQNAFALFNGTQWIGSLTQLCPGNGYIIKLSNDSELAFPYVMKQNETVGASVDNYFDSPIGTFPDQNFEHTMMVVAQTNNPNDIVYAYIGDSLSGIGKAEKNEHLIFMTIGSQSATEKEISFKVWYSDSQKLVNSDQKVLFQPMSQLGDVRQPFSIFSKK